MGSCIYMITNERITHDADELPFSTAL